MHIKKNIRNCHQSIFFKTESLHNFLHFIVLIGLSSDHECIKIISERNDLILDQCALCSTVMENDIKQHLNLVEAFYVTYI